MLELVVLDVGHGNCTVVRDGARSALIDVPQTKQLIPALTRNGCEQVVHLLLSHADQDHIGGAAKMLADPAVTIDNLWCSPTAIQDTETYLDLLHQAALRHEQRLLRYHSNLNVGVDRDLDFDRVSIDVLHPDIVMAGIGPTPARHKLGPITSNRMSAVIRVQFDGTPVALLPGDLDDAGFRSLLSRGVDLRAPLLVFPHHGGSGGRDNRAFARDLCSAVQPEVVVFSLGRSRFANPLPQILEGVREAAPAARVACTQLSKNCHSSDELPAGRGHLLESWPSAGAGKGRCCSGSVVVRYLDGAIVYEPSAARHLEFIRGSVPTPRCDVVIPAPRLASTLN
ncbi:ComEC/Rec2 family competence protein [Verrucosispora sp. TAA-831]|uniref:ComEC/Rec2 family competence protein n=1 Tax=Verrucosispora sp. TAA-831 TaxID=3422227 RepID=UPI003D6F6335